MIPKFGNQTYNSVYSIHCIQYTIHTLFTYIIVIIIHYIYMQLLMHNYLFIICLDYLYLRKYY